MRFPRAVVRARLLFSPSVQSSSIGKVYLIRLYMAFFTALALALLLLVESIHTFPLPYMFQGASLHIDTFSWAARFQANTLKIMTVPLLFGNVLNLMMWAGAKLDMVEIEYTPRAATRRHVPPRPATPPGRPPALRAAAPECMVTARLRTLFALKKAKERRLFGEVGPEVEEEPGHQAEAMLKMQFL